jgi:hypothetical protein
MRRPPSPVASGLQLNRDLPQRAPAVIDRIAEKPTGTPNQDFFSSFGGAFGGERTARSGRKKALQGEERRIPLSDGVLSSRSQKKGGQLGRP